MLKQTFYTLSEIAPKTPYSAEYLSLLARKGKLRAVKMDAAWMTTEDWVEEYQQSIAVTEPVSGVSAGGNYLSAAEAAEGTPYGSEYLALRIRQGKIRGEKINGRWHTRREWVEEYVAGISNPASNVRGLDTLDFGVRAAWKASAPLRRAAAADNARFYPTRLLAAGLTATIAFLFVAPPQVWAHWGVSASLAVTRSFDLGADGAARAARQLAANPRFTEPLSRVQAAARLGVMSLSLLNRTQHTASERLASRFGLDTAPRSGADAPFGGRDAFEQKGGPAAASVGAAAALGVGAGGQVAGAFGVRLLAPKTFSFSGALTRALALPGTSLKGAITFLNPNDLAVNLARLSGNAIEAGQSLAQLDLATGITQSVSQLSSRINAISILQPAGQYAVSLRGGVDAPGGRDADGQSVPAAEGVEAAPVFGPSRLGTSSDGTLMVGTLPLQAAANTFTNQNNPSETALQIVSTGSGAILQGISPNGDIVFQVSDAGVLKVGAASTIIDTNSVTTGTVSAQSVRAAGSVSAASVSANTLSVAPPPHPLLNEEGEVKLEVTSAGVDVTGLFTANGAVSLNDTLTVAKDVHALANLIADAAITANSLTVGRQGGSDAESGGDAVSLTVNGSAVINAPLAVNDTLTAKNANITGSLTVAGDTTLSDNTTIGGNLTIARNLNVKGTFSPQSVIAPGPISGYSIGGVLGSFDQLNSKDASFGGSDNDVFLVNSQATFGTSATFNSILTVNGAATLASTLAVTGASTLTGNTSIGGALTVTGASTLSSATITTLAVTGSQAVTGTFSVATSTTASPQFKTGYDATNYLSFSTGSGGTTTISSLGGQYASLIAATPLRIATTSAFALEVRDSAGTANLLTVNTSTNRLGIGTTTPGALLSVGGASLFGGTLRVTNGATLDSTLAVADTATFTSNILVNSTTATSTFAHGVSISGVLGVTSGTLGLGTGSATTTLTSLAGNLGIATVNPTFQLDVTGNARFTSLVDASYFTATSTTATSTFAGGLAIETSGLVYDYSTNRVGIGTASPSSALHVQNTTSPQLTLAYDANNYYTTDISSTGEVAFIAYGGSGAGFLFSDDVNIATTTATQFTTGYDTANYLAFQTNASGTTTLDAIGGQYASLIVADPIRIATTSAFALEVRDSAGTANLLTVNTSSNRIGVNNASPTFTLDVTGNARFSSFVDASYFVATSTTATSTFAGGLAVDTSDFVVDPDSGRVGIGTASPVSVFHLQSSATSPQITLGYDSANYYTTDISSTGEVAFIAYGGSGAGFLFSDDLNIATTTATQFTTGYDTANYLAFQTNSSGTTTLDVMGGQYASLIVADPLRIATTSAFALEVRDSAGTANLLTVNTSTNRLGIGTTTPGALLSVGGASLFGGTLRVTNGATLDSTLAVTDTATFTANINVNSTTATSTFASGLSINGFLDVYDGTINLGTGSATTTLTSLSGNLGIGSTTPWGYLSVNAPGGKPALVVGSSTTQFIVDTNGNVGIGTTGPVAPLHVVGSSDQGVRISGGSNARLTLVSSDDSTNTWNFDNSSGSLRLFREDYDATGNGANGSVKITIQDDGDFGLGTTAPLTRFHVADTANLGRYLQVASSGATEIRGNDNSIYNALTLTNAQNGAADYGTALLFNHGYGGSSTVLGTTVNSGRIVVAGEQSWTATASTQDSYMALSTTLNGTLTEYMRINSAGYIGVSSTTPQALLAIEQSTETASFQISNQGSSTPSFFVGGVNQDGRIGIGTSTPTALLTVQEDNTTGNIVEITDSNTSTPTFRIAATTGEITTRGDFTQADRTDLTTLANINDVFVYDTTKDTDGGAWTKDANAQASSWYNETLDNTGASCVIGTDDRCGRREFPEKTIIVAYGGDTSGGVDIYDAKDNTLWMRFNNGTSGTAETVLRSSTSAAVYALNGELYVGKTPLATSYGAIRINFKRDDADFWHTSGLYAWPDRSGLKDRNVSIAEATNMSSATFNIVNDASNNISAAVINGKTYVAVATNAGVSVVNETDKTVIDFDVNSADDVNDVYLASDGTLYYSTETAQTLNVFRNVHLRASDKTSGSADLVYDENGVNVGGSSSAPYPAIFTSARTINDIFVIEDSSFVDGGVIASGAKQSRGLSNTVFIAHAAGLTKLSENTASSTLSSVKYYQTATTTEEMVGDIRGMWPFAEQLANAPDASIKGNTLTGTNIAAADYVTGVRGTGIAFDGSTENLRQSYDADFDFGLGNFTLGAWINRGTVSSQEEIFNREPTSGSTPEIRLLLLSAGTAFFTISNDDGATADAVTSITELDNSAWHAVVAVREGQLLKIYVDGKLEATDTIDTATGTMTGGSPALTIGQRMNDTAGLAGTIDEPFVTATALTASQIKYMYEVGKQALNNHTASKIGSITADLYQELYGSSDNVTSVSFDDPASAGQGIIYVGTNDGSNGGGVSAIGLYSDTLEDVWSADSGINKADDDGTVFNADDIVSVSVSGRYPKTLVIGTDTELWAETESFSFDRYRNTTQNPHGAHLVQTALTVSQDLTVGQSFAVLGDSVRAYCLTPQQEGCKPTFRVAADGTVSVRDDLILQGHTTLQSLSNINDVFVYDTTKDTDNGAWTNDTNAKATSWYNEAIDATGAACDITANDRCGSRPFPQKAIIVATNTNLYIFDAKDNTMWMRFDTGTNLVAGGTASLSSVFALNGVVYFGVNGTGNGVRRADFINDHGSYYSTLGTQDKSTLAQRNTVVSDVDTNKGIIVNDVVNDVHAAVVCSENRVSQATQRRKAAGSNRIPQSGINWLSSSGQNRLATPSPHFRQDNYITKNNPTIAGEAVYGPALGDVVPLPDNQYQYSTLKNFVKGVVDKLFGAQTALAETFGIKLPQGCKTYVAVATDGGVSVINETDETVVDGVYTNYQIKKTYLAEDGTLYYSSHDPSSNNDRLLYVLYNVHKKSSDFVADTTLGEGGSRYFATTSGQSPTTPGLPGDRRSDDINQILVTTGTSFVDGKSNTIYVATDAALTKISEKQGDETNGAVKYYTQDYISEEMVGDIRGMWPFGEDNFTEDVSVKTNDLTATSIDATDLVPGVRGTALDFDGSTEYLTIPTASDADVDFNGSEAFSISAWVRSDTAPGSTEYDSIVSKWDTTSDLQAYTLLIYNDDADSTSQFEFHVHDESVDQGLSVKSLTDSVSQNIWYHVVGTFNGGTAGAANDVKLYVNGVLVNGSAANTSFLGIEDVATDFTIGDFDVTDVNAVFDPLDGVIDEVTVTAEVLSPAQIKHMYETGKRALEQKSLAAVTNATDVGNDRIGDTSISVADGGWINSFIEITGGTGIGQTRRIVATSTTTFYIDPPFDITPDTTSDFQVISNSIYIKDSSTATTVQSIFVDENAGVMYVGVNNTDNTGGVTAIGLDSDTILDVWHNQSGKTDDAGNNWNADDVVAIGAGDSIGGSSRLQNDGNSASSWSGAGGGAIGSGILAIATDAELWTQSAGQSIKDVITSNENPIANNLTVKSQAQFSGRFSVKDSEPQAIFAVDDNTKDVTIREDIQFGSETKLTSLANINDVYVYDTTKDSDGGEWTCNDVARGTSWYNEPLNTSTRGKTKCFPRKAVVVGTNTKVYIYDAKDNSMWMVLNQGNSNWSNLVAGNADLSQHRVIATFALNGRVYVASGLGVSQVDFRKDGGFAYAHVGQQSSGPPNLNIANRNINNGADNYVTYISALDIVSNTTNDIHAAVVNGKTYVAVATDGGLSVINETDGTVSNNDQLFAYTGAFISSTGNLYGVQTNGGYAAVRTLYNLNSLTGASWTADVNNYLYNTTPAIAGGASSGFDDIYVTGGTSNIDGSSNTIYIANNVGLSVIQEKQGDETNGSVKYYTKDYITEEMVGDIRGMWGFWDYGVANSSDDSVKTNTLTGTSIATANYVSGVRGWSVDLDGANDYFTIATADDADLDFNGSEAFSISAWVRSDTAPGSTHYDGIVTKYENDTPLRAYYFALFNDDGDTTSNLTMGAYDESANQIITASSANDTVAEGVWYHVVGTFNGGTAGAAGDLLVYLNGVQVGSNSANASFLGIEDLAVDLAVGGWDVTDTNVAIHEFDGVIDEVMVTAEVLTPSQIKRMYENGKRALESGVEGVASSATSAHSAFRVGVAAGAVPYTAGEFINSIIQVYDGPGSATSTRFITQTASSTSDYYIQFKPDHSAAVADNDTFSIGPNLFAGTTNRVTAVAVDDYADFIYIGTTSGTGSDGSVSKIALDSDTLVDVWHTDIGKTDDLLQPYGGASTTAIAFGDNTLAVANNSTNGGGVWSETAGESLDRALTKPKTVFTVIDRLDVPYINSPNGVLTFTTGSSTAFQMTVATSTGNTFQLRPSTDGNLLLGDDMGRGIYIADGGNVGIGRTSPQTKLHLAGTNVRLAISNDADNNWAEIGNDGATGENDLVFFTGNSATPYMTIKHSGNVGIGTTTPAVALNVIGALCVDDSTPTCADAARTAGTVYAVGAYTQSLDLAENYPTKDASLVPGEVVMISARSGDGAFVSRADGKQKALGIISPKPGVLLGGFDSEQYKDERQVAVALSGRIPVAVSLENGPINRGDYLTLSKTKPGYAAKLVGSGQVIGIALQSYNGTPLAPLYEGQPTNQVVAFVTMFYKYDDASIVRVFDTKIIDIQKQIDSLKARVDSLEQWRAKKENVMLEGGVPAD